MLRRHAFALAPLAAAALWGGMYVVSKWGFSSIPPVTLGFLRVAVGAATLLVVVRRAKPRRSFSARDRREFVVLGGWVALTIATQFLGTEWTNASQGALVTVLTPVFTVLLGAAALGETVTRRKASGIGLATAGTVLVLVGRYDLAGPAAADAARLAAANLPGVAALLVASAAWAAYTVQGKRLIRAYSALEAATYSTVAAVPMLAALAVVELAATGVSPTALPATLPVVGAVLYLGVLSTAAAWYLWYKGLEFVGAGTVAVYFFAQPVVGATLGVLLLGERVGPTFVAGGAVMAAGIYVVSTARAE